MHKFTPCGLGRHSYECAHNATLWHSLRQAVHVDRVLEYTRVPPSTTEGFRPCARLPPSASHRRQAPHKIHGWRAGRPPGAPAGRQAIGPRPAQRLPTPSLGPHGLASLAHRFAAPSGRRRYRLESLAGAARVERRFLDSWPQVGAASSDAATRSPRKASLCKALPLHPSLLRLGRVDGGRLPRGMLLDKGQHLQRDELPLVHRLVPLLAQSAGGRIGVAARLDHPWPRRAEPQRGRRGVVERGMRRCVAGWAARPPQRGR